jgi:hypothetical protein
MKDIKKTKTKLRGLSPLANYTDRATTACGEVSANFCGKWVPRGQRDGSLQSYSRTKSGAATFSS